jgi:integrase
MIFEEIEKRTGKKFIVASRYWPDGTRFRRRFSNKTLAKSVLGRIEGAIAIVGHVMLREFSSFHAAYFEKERAKAKNPRTDKPIAKATINRGLAVLSHMVTFAMKKKLIAGPHPMARYGRLPEEERALRVMTLVEERRLVANVMDESLVLGCYVGLLGETGLRKAEGLNLKWDYVDLNNRVLTVAASKSGKTRRVPLSDYALQLFGKLHRVCAFVFVWPDTKQPLRDPRYWFFKGRSKAGLGWVGFHDFRHFRATRWIMNGVDIRTVQGLLGHSNIQTTERYVKFVPSHASKVVIEAQRLEDIEIADFYRRQIGDTNMPEKEDNL